MSKVVSYSRKDLLIAVISSALLSGITGGLVGYVLYTDKSQPQSEAVTETMSHSHSSSTYEAATENVPTVELFVEEDKKSGYNIRIETTNFTFTPQDVNGENVDGQGHAHLYLDGEKISRLYGPYFHYDGTFEGTKTFRVELNANDHSVYTSNGMPIEATVTVSHNSQDPTHSHE